MRRILCVALVVLAYAACGSEKASAQEGSYSGKAVYGMFGPRVLGQTLQSPVVRGPNRGIARDADGNFLGINLGYSGRMFGPPTTRTPGGLPMPILPQPVLFPAPSIAPQAPQVQPAPEEFLRQGEQGSVAPPLPSAGPNLTESTWLGPPQGLDRSGGNAMVAGFSPGVFAPDPFAGRIAVDLQRTPQIKRLSPIRVEVNRQTATLRGRVATEQDRELAENLVRLEPGISDVRNQLIVGDWAHVVAAKPPAGSSGR